MNRVVAACSLVGIVGGCAADADGLAWQVHLSAPAVLDDALVGIPDFDPDVEATGAWMPPSALDTPLEESLGLAVVVEQREVDARVGGSLLVRLATEEGVDAALVEVRRLVDAFPKGFLDGVLDEIVLVDSLRDGDVAFRGYATCAARRIWVRVAAVDTPLAIRHTLFHEASHLIACVHPNDVDAWLALSTTPYLGDLRGLGEEVALGSASDALQAGFLSPYAMTTPGEDLAETTAFRMTQPDALARVAAASAVLDGKVMLVERWLGGISAELALP